MKPLQTRLIGAAIRDLNHDSLPVFELTLPQSGSKIGGRPPPPRLHDDLIQIRAFLETRVRVQSFRELGGVLGSTALRIGSLRITRSCLLLNLVSVRASDDNGFDDLPIANLSRLGVS